MRRTFPFALASAIVLAVAFAALAACSPAAERSLPAEGKSGAGSADGAASEGGRTYESTAMVVTFGEGQILFVDQDTQTPYFPTRIENADIVDAQGTAIAASDLVRGNVVRVTGNGIMLESYPGQYPGVAKVEVVDEGTPDDAARYDELIDQIWQPRDPTEPANAQIEYRTDLAIVSMALAQYTYTWEFEQDSETQTICVDTESPLQTEMADMPCACIEAATDATISFDVPAVAVQITRWSEADLAAAAEDFGSVESIEPYAFDGEKVGADLADGAATLSIEPGWRYVVEASFEAGDVMFAFSTARA